MSRTSAISLLRDRLEAKPVDQHRAIQAASGVVRFGALHEWFGLPDSTSRERWVPPLCLLTDIAQHAIADSQTRVVWIGRRCWPYPLLFDERRSVLAASVFIDPPDHASRLWCMDIASRCTHRTLVIADGSGLTLANSRRLQLAAGNGAGVCVLARPPWEERELSAATTRWMVSRERSSTSRPRWAVKLVRNKDSPVLREDTPRVVVELDHAEGALRVPTPMADRAVRSAAQAS